MIREREYYGKHQANDRDYFNCAQKKLRVVLHKEVTNGEVIYRLWRSSGKPDREGAQRESEQYYLYAEVNGQLVSLRMTESDLIERCGFLPAVRKLYGNLNKRAQLFNRVDNENTQGYKMREIMETEQQETINLGSDPIAQTDYIQAMLSERADNYLKSKRCGGELRPDFVGALVMNELEHCQELMSIYREKEKMRAMKGKEKLDAEDEYLRREKNELAQKQLESAEMMIRRGGTLDNAPVIFYPEGANEKTVPILLCLLRKYCIPVHLRTQGWIKQSLKSMTIDGNGQISITYQKSKNRKCSEKIFDCLEELVRAIRAEGDCVNHEIKD